MDAPVLGARKEPGAHSHQPSDRSPACRRSLPTHPSVNEMRLYSLFKRHSSGWGGRGAVKVALVN